MQLGFFHGIFMAYFLVVIIRYSKQCPPLAWQTKTTVHGSLNLNLKQLIFRSKVVLVFTNK